MAFKMRGFTPFTKREPRYIAPQNMSGPGAYFKNTVKYLGSKIGNLFKKKKK
mgnify:CR=1 FL=1